VRSSAVEFDVDFTREDKSSSIYFVTFSINSATVQALWPRRHRRWGFLVPPATGAHEVACCKYFCVPNIDLLRVTNEEAPCFRVVSTVLNLLEESLHWLLGIPSLAHVFEVDLEVDRSDVALSLEEVIQHASC
jgi:hypothetical protein